MIEQKLARLISLPNTFIGEAPIGIDNCQWVKSGGGSTDVHFNKDNYDKPTFAIYIRNKNNEEALRIAQESFKRIRNYTDARGAIIATRLPAFVGKDDKHRTIYTFQIEYQTGSY